MISSQKSDYSVRSQVQVFLKLEGAVTRDACCCGYSLGKNKTCV